MHYCNVLCMGTEVSWVPIVRDEPNSIIVGGTLKNYFILKNLLHKSNNFLYFSVFFINFNY